MMKIRDIVNRDIVNLTNCEHEPIHIPGSIQPHGFLLAFHRHGRQIIFCSGNTAAFIGVGHEQLLTKTVQDVFGAAQVAEIDRYIPSLTGAFVSPLPLQLNGTVYSTIIHSSGDMYVMEFEPAQQASYDPSVYYNQTRQIVAYMEESASMQDLCQRVAEETRAITGYDRVMIYRFDTDYNGEVFAESRRDDLEPFLGLHYPHTDIPAQARELYKKNLLRLIADVGYIPVPLYTIDDGTANNLDLSHAVLRSVSPIHIEYLHNIGVGATLTISLLHNNKLWGLIACHHYSPKYIDGFVRISAQLQGHFLTSQITVRKVEEEHRLARQTNASLDRMLARIFSLEREQLDTVVKQNDLLSLCNASGVAVFVNDQMYTHGDVPEYDDIASLIHNLQQQPSKHVHTAQITELYAAPERMIPKAAGILFHRLDDVMKMGIVWFRNETIQEVKWAGDPEKAIVKDEKGLSPRKSFELWRQFIKGQSNAWREAELSAAANFAKSLERQMHLLIISDEERKYRVLTEKLRHTNAELENMNWISTHDLKEPLRKIQLFTSYVLDKGDAVDPDVLSSIVKVNASANRMQRLLADIMAYSRIHHTADDLVPVSLERVLGEVLRERHDDISDARATIHVSPLPVVRGSAFLLQQLFSNLLDNALKFSKPGVATVVSVSARIVHDPLPHANGAYHEIGVHDNGIGFGDEHRESIFNIFSRLHDAATYSGSGIGLAICKKVMQKHGGHIVATGRAGHGASFVLYFPQG